MGGTSQPHGEIIAGINVTPLVDITLVLLIIFVVTAKIMVAPAVPMDLPRAQTSEEVQVVFSVLLPRAGPLLVNGEPALGDDDVVHRSRLARARDADVRAVVQADGDVPHRRVMHVLDLIKQGGITRVAFGALASEEDAF